VRNLPRNDDTFLVRIRLWNSTTSCDIVCVVEGGDTDGKVFIGVFRPAEKRVEPKIRLIM